MSIASTQEQKKLSILVPTYNVTDYILECLESIETQLTSECEVIVYDDASTDNTVDVIKSSSIYKKNNFKLELCNQNKGVSFARNALIGLATGEYIWFCDSDDKIMDTAIKKILNAINTSNADTIFFNYNIWPEIMTEYYIENGLEQKTYIGQPGINSTNNTSAFIATVKSNNLHPHCKVYHKKLFSKETKFPVGHVFEDISITPLLASLSKTIFYIDEPLYAYRQRAGSIVASMLPEDEVKPFKAILDLKNRYENLHGRMDEDALNATIGFCTHQLRTAIRRIDRTLPDEKKAVALREILDVFKSIHHKNYFYIMKCCYCDKGIKYCYLITRRLIRAKYITSKISLINFFKK